MTGSHLFVVSKTGGEEEVKYLPRNSSEASCVATNIGAYFEVKNGSGMQWEMHSPFVISFNIPGLAYKDGFKNPIGFLPAPRRASLSLVITDEKIGVLAEVPPNELATPSQ